MAPVFTSFSSCYSTPTAFLTEAVYAGPAMTDDLSPSPVPSIIYHTPTAPDPGLHQFIIYMVILAAVFLLYCAYILGKSYIGKRCGTDDDDEDDEKKLNSAGEAFRPPTIALPAPSATFNRSDPWLFHHQMAPAYISQADMLSSSRGFFG
ncbi:hypothetical protein DFH08DRAFT_803468 [Mycena albidolilacea]|uniref:Uncharacterized protein n=1 Tax=Mycena albidolilacea TaxID=1033008 RepID=A0AAD7EXG4_9AGAR|nr:hypothetical protein DFH08DRAFT_803468 [Mycena albidolilacea]